MFNPSNFTSAMQVPNTWQAQGIPIPFSTAQPMAPQQNPTNMMPMQQGQSQGQQGQPNQIGSSIKQGAQNGAVNGLMQDGMGGALSGGMQGAMGSQGGSLIKMLFGLL